MVFLPGEVVVDYATKVKQLFDSSRVWVHAYSNDSPCYIPSERILQEGGYEGGGAMVYYDVPVPFVPGLESKILASVQSLLPEAFRNPFDAQKTLGSIPAPPQKAAQLAKVTPGLEVQLAVAEPLITSPVAIDFGPDGRLWVAEMSDYRVQIRVSRSIPSRIILEGVFACFAIPTTMDSWMSRPSLPRTYRFLRASPSGETVSWFALHLRFFICPMRIMMIEPIESKFWQRDSEPKIIRDE